MGKKYNKFYVLEGLDSAGKNSVGEILEEEGFPVIEIPFKEMIQKLGAIPKTFEKRVQYFMRCNELYVSQASKGESVGVLNRYYPTTIIGNALMFNRNYKEVEKIARSYSPVEPIQTFFMTVERAEQKRRMIQKGLITEKDSQIFHSDSLDEVVRNFYNEQAKEKKWITIDSTKRTPENIAYQILNTIRK